MTDERRIKTRLLRPGAPIPPEISESWTAAEERIEAVFMLSALCAEWMGIDPRLQRHHVRIIRPAEKVSQSADGHGN